MDLNTTVPDLNDLSYVIIPSKLRAEQKYAQAYNKIFNFWEKSWEKTFNASGSPKGHWQDHFLRQDVIVALLNKGEPIGCILSTLYDVRVVSTMKSEYFKYISAETVDKLLREKMNVCMTMEYLCVSPAVKINKQQLGVGKLLVALTTNVARSLGADCALGMPISGTKVDKMIANMGGIIVQPNIEKYGYTLQLMVTPAQKNFKSEDAQVEQYRNSLWDSRQDYSEKTYSTDFSRQAA